MKTSYVWIFGSVLALVLITMSKDEATPEKQITIKSPEVVTDQSPMIIEDSVEPTISKTINFGNTIGTAMASDSPQLLDLNIDGPLPVSEAFNYKSSISGSKATISFNIANGYHLYQDSIHFLINDKKITNVAFPPSVTLKDELTGDREAYDGRIQFIINLPSETDVLKTKYQGCWDGGVCYPPQTETAS
jgi:thiol:disulfide interchange protein DsbD